MMDDNRYNKLIADYPDTSCEASIRICAAVSHWWEHGDADVIDAAVILACQNEIPIKGGFLEAVASLAKERAERADIAKKRISKRNNFYRDHIVDNQHLEIFRLNYFCGLTREESIGIVAVRLLKEDAWPRRKMDTLRREHRKWREEHAREIKTICSRGEKWSDNEVKDYLLEMGYDLDDPLLAEVAD